MQNYKYYIGKKILIDLRYYNPEGVFKGSQHIAGTIIENLDNRIRLLPVGSDMAFHLPPDLSLLEDAEPIVYTLQNGNVETFDYPDYTVIFNIEQGHDRWEAMGSEGFVWPKK